MRLGGPIFKSYSNPQEWAARQRELGFTAVYFPCDSAADKYEIRSYQQETEKNGFVIAEVGAWSNPLSKNQAEAEKALAYCQNQLALADEIGARCCVNIAGSLGDTWDGPHPDSFSQEAFERVVTTVRQIIDAVSPKRTFYALELMPWMFPDSPDSNLRLIEAVDRRSFAVHLDPVNIICSPRAYYNNGDVIRECFEKLGPYIKSCHAKDILLEPGLTTHLSERRIGEGTLDYKAYLTCLNLLDKDTPIMLEHLSSHEDVVFSAGNIRKYAATEGICL